MRIVIILLSIISLGLCVPVTRDFASSTACSSVYHGQCIDTYKFQCLGIAIPGICGNMTHFSGIDVHALTQLQCCNSWLKVQNSGTVVVGESTDGPFMVG